MAYDDGVIPELESARVYLEGPNGERVEVSDAFTVAPTGSFEAVCPDLKATAAAAGVELTPDWLVVLEYTAPGNFTATGTSGALTSTAYVDYTSSPVTTGSIGRSVEDAATVVTWRLSLIQRDESSGDTLAGAVFTLQNEDGLYLAADGTLSETPVQLTVADDGTLEIVGLDSGIYTLTEVNAPSGHQGIGTVTITFTATPQEGEMVQGSEEDGWQFSVQCDSGPVQATPMADGLSLVIFSPEEAGFSGGGSSTSSGSTSDQTSSATTSQTLWPASSGGLTPLTGDPLLAGTTLLLVAGGAAGAGAFAARRKKNADGSA